MLFGVRGLPGVRGQLLPPACCEILDTRLNPCEVFTLVT